MSLLQIGFLECGPTGRLETDSKHKFNGDSLEKRVPLYIRASKQTVYVLQKKNKKGKFYLKVVGDLNDIFYLSFYKQDLTMWYFLCGTS